MEEGTAEEIVQLADEGGKFATRKQQYDHWNQLLLYYL